MATYNGIPYQGYGYQTYYPQTYQAPFMMNQQMQQPVQTTVQQQAPVMFGRLVSRPEDISAGDVPTNGAPAYFPVQDGSAIYMKHWNANGGIDTIRYIPETIDTKVKEEPNSPILNEILERLSKIEKTLTE